MTSLKSVLAFNMKAQRLVLGITQAQLAERVNTSTNYIALIEVGRKFPSLEMLERIAKALEIEPIALFSTKTYPQPEDGTLAQLHKQILSDISEVVSLRLQKFGGEAQYGIDPNTEDSGSKLV